ncbi:MAG: 4Fe-4S dicluster domain-containing protein [Candidatus Omnitrophica bacterium]|nr:4Fe-4S dicluster domain-containing protein [Candidatus Omnitrophota bacterium]MDD5352497.1 4Fe-4S dicluster domain-containing protein [Candidatus Omnitrophota bacterium]MDD5550095.1 4Fe-4S dicluster domain-containing protein [Candidatus Omnitrophota bacterium]
MKYPKLRELKEAVVALIKGPYTSKFPRQTHKPHPNFRGRPKYNQDICVGCLACENVCPVGAIAHRDSLEDKPPKRTMIHYSDTCIFCGQCQAYCITKEGIKLSNEWELSMFDRRNCEESIEKELLLCEVCGAAIGCKDHIIWIAKELGELAYSNPTLYMTRLKELGISDDDVKSAVNISSRSDRMKIVCARCRRKTTLTTEKI